MQALNRNRGTRNKDTGIHSLETVTVQRQAGIQTPIRKGCAFEDIIPVKRHTMSRQVTHPPLNNNHGLLENLVFDIQRVGKL